MIDLIKTWKYPLFVFFHINIHEIKITWTYFLSITYFWKFSLFLGYFVHKTNNYPEKTFYTLIWISNIEIFTHVFVWNFKMTIIGNSFIYMHLRNRIQRLFFFFSSMLHLSLLTICQNCGKFHCHIPIWPHWKRCRITKPKYSGKSDICWSDIRRRKLAWLLEWYEKREGY